MPTSLPFHVAPEVEEYLRCVAVLPGREAGIALASRFTACNRERQTTDSYEGPFFAVRWHDPGVWSGIQIEIAGRTFWMPPAAVDALRSKTLTVLRRYDGQRQAGRIRDLLIAA